MSGVNSYLFKSAIAIGLLNRNPTPIYYFLLRRAQARLDTLAKERLKMIDGGLIPNTPEWHKRLGTNPCYVSGKPIGGRFLFNHNEPEVPTNA